MPIYEYLCQSCGHELETLQKLSDAPLVDCPVCGVSALKKKLTAAAFRLKGTGWYETDFKHGRQGAPGSSNDTSKKDGDADGATSGDGGARNDGRTESTKANKADQDTKANSTGNASKSAPSATAKKSGSASPTTGEGANA